MVLAFLRFVVLTRKLVTTLLKLYQKLFCSLIFNQLTFAFLIMPDLLYHLVVFKLLLFYTWCLFYALVNPAIHVSKWISFVPIIYFSTFFSKSVLTKVSFTIIAYPEINHRETIITFHQVFVALSLQFSLLPSTYWSLQPVYLTFQLAESHQGSVFARIFLAFFDYTVSYYSPECVSVFQSFRIFAFRGWLFGLCTS